MSLAPDVPLFVRGLRGTEDAAAFDGQDPEGSLAPASRVVCLALCDAQARPVLTPDVLELLYSEELHELALAVSRGLNVVSPALWRCDIAAWSTFLEKGASHPTNIADVLAMVDSSDMLAFSDARQWQPDRYFGMPIADLTDGQKMAYDAAQAAYRRLGK